MAAVGYRNGPIAMRLETASTSISLSKWASRPRTRWFFDNLKLDVDAPIEFAAARPRLAAARRLWRNSQVCRADW